LHNLKRGLAPVYFVYGEELLLVEESCRAIRNAAHAAGFLERQVLTVESGFDWNGFFASTQSLSLFSERRLIELRLPTGKPGEAGAKILTEVAAQPPADRRVKPSGPRRWKPRAWPSPSIRSRRRNGRHGYADAWR
jgi:DNA polymerase-3 subunit delta